MSSKTKTEQSPGKSSCKDERSTSGESAPEASESARHDSHENQKTVVKNLNEQFNAEVEATELPTTQQEPA